MTDKIREVLADPEAVSKIAAIASSLSGGSNSASPPASAPAFAPAEPSAPVSLPSFGKDPRVELLRALKPLVAEEKRGRLDSLVQIATVASLLGSMNKKGGIGHV